MNTETPIWYKNPLVLLSDINQVIPLKTMSLVEQSNSLARLAILSALFIWIAKFDKTWFAIPLILLVISAFINIPQDAIEPLTLDSNITGACQKPTISNPFMNYTIGDLIDGSDRPPACNIEKVREETKQAFRHGQGFDSADIWGQSFSDRNFVTMPNTDIVNDQTGFALALLGNSGQCKMTGSGCLKIIDPAYQRGRVTSVEIE